MISIQYLYSLLSNMLKMKFEKKCGKKGTQKDIKYMYSILAFDNRSLDNGVYYSNFDLETDNGMNSYQKLSMRMILQSLVAVDENSKKNRLSNIILPTSFQSVGPVSIDETTTIPFLQETIRSNHSLMSHVNVLSDSWTGLFTNILNLTSHINKAILPSSQKPIVLTILTNDVALFGYKDRRRLDELSVTKFASELKKLKEEVAQGVYVKMICVNISSSNEQDHSLDQLRLKSEKIIQDEIQDMPSSFLLSACRSKTTTTTTTTNMFSLLCMENSSVYYESLLRMLILSSINIFTSKLIFPKTSFLEASLDVELVPYTLSAMNSFQPGLAKMNSIQLIPNTAIAAGNIDGHALLVRPAEITYAPKNRSNMMFFVALSRLLVEEASILLIRTDVLAFKGDSHSITYHQYWAMVPDFCEPTQMTLIKLVDNEDLLQDGTDRFSRPAMSITAVEEMEIKQIQNGLKNMFLENRDAEIWNKNTTTSAGTSYNPITFNTMRFDCFIEADLRLAALHHQQQKQKLDRGNTLNAQEHNRSTPSPNTRANNTSWTEHTPRLPPLQMKAATKTKGASSRVHVQCDNENRTSNKSIPGYSLPSTRTMKRRRAKTNAKSIIELSSSDDDDFVDEP